LILSSIDYCYHTIKIHNALCILSFFIIYTTSVSASLFYHYTLCITFTCKFSLSLSSLYLISESLSSSSSSISELGSYGSTGIERVDVVMFGVAVFLLFFFSTVYLDYAVFLTATTIVLHICIDFHIIKLIHSKILVLFWVNILELLSLFSSSNLIKLREMSLSSR
jgi:hypothetical protein